MNQWTLLFTIDFNNILFPTCLYSAFWNIWLSSTRSAFIYTKIVASLIKYAALLFILGCFCFLVLTNETGESFFLCLKTLVVKWPWFKKKNENIWLVNHLDGSLPWTQYGHTCYARLNILNVFFYHLVCLEIKTSE